ncbi:MULTISPECIES: fimbria/pilus chaperone family protein [unclassified Herbaspirillum]|uniref:fimbria/pilus chaperone family protein n=1 Tax=unclassified Herbaspirillum TaxID=2624150 RepID=UPI001168401C|nr:P pilus assembly chaperone PapD [Herbaspirillum sp. SJZ130]TQK15528.1 P pilus assembly chaperone PapD [Herbaspirillum sp. SJZ106]TWC71428.1 P pilus assembly chaperone PapD [Herbaspirillum sp. SJZ099]
MYALTLTMQQKHMRGLACLALLAAACAAAPGARASGMLPETSVVIVNEADGEASMNVKNTDAAATLLYTSIQNLPEDQESLLVVSPPVARVEAEQTQLVRFILQLKEPLKTQRLKRVIFEGIPQKGPDGGVKVTMNVRQNLPLIIHPKNLPLNREPWKLLSWSISGDSLVMRNDSAYVVRFAQAVALLPSMTEVDMSRTYILPGEKLSGQIKGNAAGTTAVRLSPATVYGFSVDTFDAPLAKP